MSRKFKKGVPLPSTKQIEEELERVRRKKEKERGVKSVFMLLATAASIVILVLILVFPLLQIQGPSMTPTLYDSELVVCIRDGRFRQGDVVAFRFNNRTLVKRVIATAGDWVDINEDGVVFVNGNELKEPYVSEPAFGDCDIRLPYQVPESRIFVMGDHRSVSLDSRNTAIGCIAEDTVVGKLCFRFWPFESFGEIG